MLDQERNVARPSAQRRHGDGEDVEPVVEILAELALGDESFQIAVGGGDQAHVHFDRLDTAHAFELTLLQNPQQLDMDVEGKVAHFVEKQGAAVSQLEATRPARPSCSTAGTPA